VQDAVYLRSEQLSKTGRDVIYLAAVIGRHFDFELLRTLTHYSDAKLLAFMKEFIAAQLIVEESAKRFVFRHVLTRQALYNHLLARERKSLHQSIAESIELIYASNLDRYC
jgi:predicted ATPase